MSRYPLVPLGEVLELRSDEVDVEASGEYDIAGVYGFGRGVFARGPIPGSETSYRRLNRLHAEYLVMSRLKAFEGAVAVVSRSFDGWFVSQEFPTFAPDESQVLASYLGHLCRWPRFWDLLRSQSKGVGARRERVHSEQLLTIEIPLPDLDEQRRVVARLDSLLGQVEAVRSVLATHDKDLLVGLYPALVERTLQRYAVSSTRLGDLAQFVSDVVHPGDPLGPAGVFVGLQHVESHTGRRVGELLLGDEKGRKFRFAPGDVVYGYLRPYLNKVWVADRHGLCSVDQYVLRTRGDLTPNLLGHVLRSRVVLKEAVRLTHNLQLPRLRSGLLAEIEIPMVAVESRESVERAFDSELRSVLRLADLWRVRQRRIGALSGSILNRAFAGAL